MNSVVKQSLTLSALLTATLSSPIAFAHSQSGSLSKSVRSVDMYLVTCSAEGGESSSHLKMAVKDNAPVAKPIVSVQVIKGTKATSTRDARDGNAKYSPATKTKAGDGGYYVVVDKTAGGVEDYTLDYHCESATGTHTGTSTVQLQNQ